MISYVVESGPSGVFVATALLKKGYRVIMLDYGNDLSEKTKSIVM